MSVKSISYSAEELRAFFEKQSTLIIPPNVSFKVTSLDEEVLKIRSAYSALKISLENMVEQVLDSVLKPIEKSLTSFDVVREGGISLSGKPLTLTVSSSKEMRFSVRNLDLRLSISHVYKQLSESANKVHQVVVQGGQLLFMPFQEPSKAQPRETFYPSKPEYAAEVLRNYIPLHPSVHLKILNTHSVEVAFQRDMRSLNTPFGAFLKNAEGFVVEFQWKA